jgi:hypothetical protein
VFVNLIVGKKHKCMEGLFSELRLEGVLRSTTLRARRPCYAATGRHARGAHA